MFLKCYSCISQNFFLKPFADFLTSMIWKNYYSFFLVMFHFNVRPFFVKPDTSHLFSRFAIIRNISCNLILLNHTQR